jgi:hypothetical protein
MAVLTNPIGLLYAEIDSAGSLKLTGDRVLYGAKKPSLAETEWLTRQKVAQYHESIARIVHSHGGIVCAIAGDQVFCNLPNPDATVQAACEIQQEQGRHASTETHDVSDIVTKPIGIRVATHYAPLVVNSGRIQGPAREAAHAILKHAEADQIVASKALVDALAPQARGRMRELGTWSLGGDDGHTQVYDVDWSDANKTDAVPTPSAFDTSAVLALLTTPQTSPEATRTDASASVVPLRAVPIATPLDLTADELRTSARANSSSGNSEPVLVLRFKGKKLVLDRAQPTLMLRRGKGRQEHAKIILYDETFILENLNPEGTRVRGSDGNERLCTESEELVGIGAISLGDDFSPDSQVIQFSTVE